MARTTGRYRITSTSTTSGCRPCGPPATGRVGLQYRDNTGLEVDAIVQRPEGQWAAFEVKLGTGMIDHAATNLLRFAKRVDTSRSRSPTALAVIVARGYGYVRPDGIHVIPVGALGP